MPQYMNNHVNKQALNLPAILTPQTDKHGILRKVATPVMAFNQALLQQVEMLHAMLQHTIKTLGFGRAMAAPQAGIAKRIIVLNLADSQNISLPVTLINPEIIWRSTATQAVWDDCLSTPSVLVKIQRNTSISLRYQTINGEFREWLHLPADLAELLQHEIEHLDGILMIDHRNTRNGTEDNSKPNDLLHLKNRPQHRLSLSAIAHACHTIDSEFTETPLSFSQALSDKFLCNLWLKDETANAIRCFKGRGADNFIAQFAGNSTPQFVCASAGNWGLAVAWSCRKHGFALTVFVPNNANKVKVAKIREQGANIVFHGDDFDSAKLAAKAHAHELSQQATAQQSPVHFLEDGKQAAITEGAGSIGVELTRSDIHFDAVIVPVGNGALINGIARWIKAASPMTQIIGVVPAGADSMYQSWQQNRVVNRSTVNTCADGLAVRMPIPDAINDMHGLVDRMILVTEQDIQASVKLAESHAGLVLEPSGAAALAGLMAGFNNPEQNGTHNLYKLLRNRHVALLITGANRDS